ncbi:MAG: glycine zipper domain-containing protein [Planctomycetota bacterium]
MKKAKMTINKNECLQYIIVILVTCFFVSTVLTGGCQTRAQTGAAEGVGIGALAGQAIGGNTEATLIGAAIGAGAGYIIGNEQDKKAAKEHDFSQLTPLTGTKWKLL